MTQVFVENSYGKVVFRGGGIVQVDPLIHKLSDKYLIHLSVKNGVFGAVSRKAGGVPLTPRKGGLGSSLGSAGFLVCNQE